MLCLACRGIGPIAAPAPATPTPTPTPPAEVVLESEGERGRCGVLDPETEFYGSRVSPREGRPGELLTLSGTTYRTEGWRWAPSSKIEFWWSEAKLGIPGGEGSSLLLRIRPGTACEFEAHALIPAVPPGRYFLTTLVFDGDGYGSYGLFGEHRITVL
jgi:hypothetical protein